MRGLLLDRVGLADVHLLLPMHCPIVMMSVIIIYIRTYYDCVLVAVYTQSNPLTMNSIFVHNIKFHLNRMQCTTYTYVRTYMQYIQVYD